MFELLGLVIIKMLGHGWLWHRGERIDWDETFGNGGVLFFIGFISMILIAVLALVGAVLAGGGR